MTWLTPLTGLILAAAVVPPLIFLYFLKLKRKSQAIGSTLLWQRSVEDLQANAPFQKLRRSLLLLLQLIVLGLLAAAVAQPRLHAGNQKGGKVVVLIDNSASMTAIDDAEDPVTRLETAKTQARARVESIYGGGLLSGKAGQTMVIAFSDRAEVMCSFTSSKQQLLTAIDRIRPTHGTSRIEDALRLARAYTTNVVDSMGEARPVGDPAALELFSDGRIEDLDDQVLRGEQLNYYPIGARATRNIAVTSVSVERPYNQPTAVQVFAALANYSDEGATCDIQLAVDGVAIKIEEVEIGPAEHDPSTGVLNPGQYSVVFSPFDLARGAVVEVANLRSDAVSADNLVQMVVPPPKRLKVLLVSSPRSLLTTALEGLSLDRLDLAPPAEFEQMVEDGALDPYDLIVLDDHQPSQLPPGRYLIFGAPPPLEGLNPFGTGKDQMALEWQADHPLMQYVNLDNLYVARFHLIQPADDIKVLAEGSRSPLVVWISRGNMQVVYCPFDPLDSRWPVDRSWVHFLLNAVDYLGHFGQGLTTRAYAPGEAISARLPASAGDITLTTPDGERLVQEPLDPTLWSWGPIRLSGVYRVSWDEPGRSGRQERLFAANLISNAEGDVAPAPEIRLGQERVEGLAADDTSYTPLWPWAVAACLGLLMLEWWVYHRKVFV